ncbi:MAG: insulinase family protein [Calditrichaeota bacterium]|nr:insulinase family protein [Calditrichota bacterium]
MKHLFGISFILFLLFTAGCNNRVTKAPSAAENVAHSSLLKQSLPFDSAIVKGKLPNGFTYYIRRNTEPEKRSALRLVVRAGSILEEDNERGIAHVCEHMAFNGTEHFKKQELVDYLESIGMRFGPEINAYTSFDETVYMLEVPTDSLPLLKTAFQILEDWAHKVTFDSQEVEKERGVVIEEWRLGRGARQRMMDKILPVLLKDSRYAERLPIGKIDVLRSFPADLPKKFYRKWYRPELMAVIAVGDFDPQIIKSLTEQHFSGLQDPPQVTPRRYYPVPEHDETLFAIATDPEANNTVISIDFKMKPDTQRTVNDYRQMLTDNLFSRMLTNRLTEHLQEKNPPYIYAFAIKSRLVQTCETFELTAIARENAIIPGYKTLLTEAKRIKDFGFTATELEREKKAMLREIEKAYTERDKRESSRLAEEYKRNFLYLEPVPGIETEYRLSRQLIPTIALKDVNRLTNVLITDKNRVVQITAPQNENVFVPSQDSLASLLARIDTMKVEPYVDKVTASQLISKPVKSGKVVKTSTQSEIGLTEWYLDNGVRVLLKPTQFKNDEVLFRAVSPGGYSLAPDSILVSAKLAAAIERESGLDGFSQTQLKKLLSDKLVRCVPYINELTEGLSGSSSGKDFETLLQLIYLNFTAPRFDSTAFKSFKLRMIDLLKNRSASPEVVYQDSITLFLTRHNPRYRPLTAQMIEKLDLQTARQFFRQRFADAGDFTFIFVGNIDPDAIRPLIEKYLGGLPSLKRKERWKDVTYTPPANVVERDVFKGLEPKSTNTVIFHGPFEWNLENVVKADFMVEVLRIKLREWLREEKSGTYNVSVFGQFSHFPRERYKIYFRFTCNPERVPELTADLFNQIDSLRNFGTTEKYLNKIKEIKLHEYQERLEKNGYWVNRLNFAVINDVPFDHILKIDDLIQAVTLDDIRSMAQKLLNKKRYLKVVLYPEQMD